jgi:hypothetical protein
VSVLENASSDYTIGMIKKHNFINDLYFADEPDKELRASNIYEIVHICILKTDMFYHFPLLEKVVELGESQIFVNRSRSGSYYASANSLLSRQSINQVAINQVAASPSAYQNFYNNSTPQLGNFFNPKPYPHRTIKKSASDYILHTISSYSANEHKIRSSRSNSSNQLDEISNFSTLRDQPFQNSTESKNSAKSSQQFTHLFDNIMKQDILCIVLHAAGIDLNYFRHQQSFQAIQTKPRMVIFNCRRVQCTSQIRSRPC